MNFKLSCFCILGVFLQEFLPTQSTNETNDLRVGDDSQHRERRSIESSAYFYYQEPQYPRDCKEVYEQCDDQTESGVFMIQPDGAPEPFNVHCNNSIDGGGWTVFQRRMDGNVDFYRNWNDYKTGFGFLHGEFWLGNDRISYITNQKNYEIRIDLNNVNGIPYFAKYNLFRISDEQSKYRLTHLGSYLSESTAGYDSMAYHRNQSFTTPDRDNDNDGSYNSGQYCHGGWWYKANCWGGGCTNLNGLYTAGNTYFKSIVWYGLPGGNSHIKFSELKVRPLS